MMKRMAAMICLFFALLLPLSQVLAAGDKEERIVQAFCENGMLYTYSHVPERDMNDISSAVAYIGNNPYRSEEKPVRVSAANVAVYNLVIVDISTSMPKYAPQIETFLNSLLDNAGEGALFLLATFGKEFAPLGEFTSDKEKIRDKVENLQYDARQTSLYAGIADAIQYYDKIERVDGALFNIIVVSDGIEVDQSGSTFDEVKNHINDSNVTIYTFGIKTNDPESEKSLINLGVYARTSGGMHSVLGYDDKTEKSIARDINNFIKSLYVAKFDTTTFQTTGARYPFEINFYNGKDPIFSLKKENLSIPLGANKATPPPERATAVPSASPSAAPSASPSISPSKSPAPITSAQPATNPPPTDQNGAVEDMADAATTAAAADTKDAAVKAFDWKWFLIIGGAVLVIAAIVVVLIMVKPKKQNVPTFAPHNVFMKLEVSSGQYGGKSDELYLRNELLIGRNKQCDIEFKDKDVSDQNARIFMQDGMIYIEDLNSKNGTAIGGMKIFSPNRLRSGDVISIGSVKFTLKF